MTVVHDPDASRTFPTTYSVPPGEDRPPYDVFVGALIPMTSTGVHMSVSVAMNTAHATTVAQSVTAATCENSRASRRALGVGCVVRAPATPQQSNDSKGDKQNAYAGQFEPEVVPGRKQRGTGYHYESRAGFYVDRARTGSYRRCL